MFWVVLKIFYKMASLWVLLDANGSFELVIVDFG